MLSAGSRLGQYEILAALGAGGMGEVYRARDGKLGRDVAIKILPPAFTNDPDRLARFEREARMLASLNHPNIAAIHGLEDSGNQRALVLELVEGETLGEKIAGGLSLSEGLNIARQIADALDAAHEQGIVHRDLKPANIKITTAGVVKVLDFGLAKAGGAGGAGRAGEAAENLSQSPTITAVGTRDGVILGTAAYMSPEQARGRVVDKRADIWAFGCVLYEMLTGQAVFARETISDTLAAILEREPAWAELPAATPAGVTRLLRRCLDKDPRRRLRDIADARIDLEDLLPSQGSPASGLSPRAAAGHRRKRLILLAPYVALAAAIVWIAIMWLRASPVERAPLPTSRMTAARLTHYSGSQSAAALSPDGRSFVFVSDHGGTPDIWLRQVSGGEPVRLTDDPLEETGLAFSPDGESLYFSRTEQGVTSIWRMGTLGGQPRKVVGNGHGAAPSPDGKTLAFMEPQRAGIESLVLIGLDGTTKRVLAEDVPWFPTVRPAWSPDGTRIVFSRAGLFAPANLYLVNVSDGQERQVTTLTRAGQVVGQSVWLPDNRHVAATYQSNTATQGLSDLAVIDVESGSVSRVTTTISESFSSPSISSDGTRLVTTASSVSRELWKLPVGGTNPDANGRGGVRLIDDSQSPMWVFVSRDLRTLMFNGSASGSRNLWLMPLDGSGRPQQITAVAGDAIGHNSLSPDGTRVAFVSFAGGASDIWIQNVDGSDLRQLTNDPAADSWPVWSPDGRSIVFTSATGASQETRVMPAGGGPSEKLMDGFFRGDWVERNDGSGTWIVTSNGNDMIRLIDVEQRRVVWEERVVGSGSALPMFSPDRRVVSVLFQEDRNHDAVAVIDVATRQRRVVARLPFRTIFRAAWADAGAAIIVNRVDNQSNVVLFDHFWEPAK